MNDHQEPLFEEYLGRETDNLSEGSGNPDLDTNNLSENQTHEAIIDSRPKSTSPLVRHGWPNSRSVTKKCSDHKFRFINHEGKIPKLNRRQDRQIKCLNLKLKTKIYAKLVIQGI